MIGILFLGLLTLLGFVFAVRWFYSKPGYPILKIIIIIMSIFTGTWILVLIGVYLGYRKRLTN